ncbi:MAG: FAD:protein FMN transferase [Bacilli bacterium]|nr:FAD:protein FMN transferase [Bacilli bacterium]
MQEKINKVIWIIVLLLILSFIGLFIYNKNKKEEYTAKFFYMDTYIYVKLYDINKETADKYIKEIENIYKKYHELTDRYNAYDNVKNIYYIKNNDSEEEYIKIDKELYDIIEYGTYYYEKTNGLVDISMGNIIDVWKKYRDNKNGIPTKEELEKANNIVKIELKNGTIKNNHPNIDLGSISKGYTTKIVGEYLKKNNINKFLINAGGNVLVGDKKQNKEYTIGIEDPNNKNDIFKIVKGDNIAVVTSGGYERYYEYEGKKYHHIINPKTLYPSNNMKSVTVITSDSALGDILSTYLFLLDIDEGKEYINNLDNVEAIWYTNDNKEIKSNGFDKYEYKTK